MCPQNFLRRFALLLFLLGFLVQGCAVFQGEQYVEPEVQAITIASFNIRIFSDKSRDDEEIDYIADILANYDIIAIQELRDKEVLQRTVNLLKERGKEYEYEVSEQVGKRVKERYAFLYRKDKVKKIQEGRLYKERKDEFIREPFYTTFKAGNFDFTLVTIHVLFGSSKKARRPEIKELATVYNKIQDEDPTEQDIILLGDFNFPPTDKGFNDLRAISTMTFLIEPPVKTTITDTSLYDNFWFQKEYVREYIGESGVNRFDEIMFNNDDNKAKRAVSDHRPIWARFDISKEDDD